MEWTPPPDGIRMCQGGGNMNATTKEEAPMKRVRQDMALVIFRGVDSTRKSRVQLQRAFCGRSTYPRSYGSQ